MIRIFSTIVFLLYSIQLLSQLKRDTQIYENAYDELNYMLNNPSKINFKRAVFVSENAYMDGKMGYRWYLDQINLLAYLSYRLSTSDQILYESDDKADVRLKAAVFRVLKDSVIFKEHISRDTIVYFSSIPYTYDFEDFFGEKDWSKMFVTKAVFK
jgi:hypothetical protein